MHARFLDAYALTLWADLPDNEPYLWDHLAEHLLAAEADLAFAEQREPSDVSLRLLIRNFANMGHLLNRFSTYTEIAAVLLSRLMHLQELSDLYQASEQDMPRPYLASGTCCQTCQIQH